MNPRGYYHQKALLELEQGIRERCVNRGVKNDGAELKELLMEVCLVSDVVHAGNFVFSAEHHRAEQILIFTEPLNAGDEYIRIIGYRIEPKKESGVTPVQRDSDIGDADKELVNFAQIIDFMALYKRIKASARVACSFGRPEINISKGNIHIEFISENIACQTGPFSAILERCYIHSFSNSVFKDKDTGDLKYWVSVHIRYEHKGGGENGMEMGTALYCDGKWEFVGALKPQQHESSKTSFLPSSIF